MAGMTSDKLSRLPEEMISFNILKTLPQIEARLGKFSFPGKATIDTPHYIGITSRGVIPHISQDVYRKHMNCPGVYIALEDYIEKVPPNTPPLYQVKTDDGTSPLKKFIALPQETITIFGARRQPPVSYPASNTNTAIGILTSIGFGKLETSEYAIVAQKVRPDIVVSIADIPFGQLKPSLKRIDKMSDRTATWMKDMISAKTGLDKLTKSSAFQLFAPILPITGELQSWYLDQLADDMVEHISGLALYESESVIEIPDQLASLPRLSFSELSNPHKLLNQVLLGMDIFTIPFIGAATDAGIALDFCFPAPQTKGDIRGRHPLGIDMWSSEHATDISSLRPNCKCYACTKHHRAYIQHLLNAKEMLAWNLLQIHNHHVMDEFFVGIRDSIESCTFEDEVSRFEQFYAVELPEKTGQGPRIRGYQFKSEGPNEPKKNPAPYTMLKDGEEKNAEAPISGPETMSKDLEAVGFAESAQS
ncbi:tRNA-guanine transglycosylase [Patellaria atrata CBS 101060]|uniref:Queuine tRNA-ribosyltransferase accessory subunit 2 n=1 Tax=Patellaria atrata CBS 101060 TaxID=1346257 RepID=A0A9P4SEL3_9PEZI|nr:tRNA-guanine transglycosylase [Patellaria atrata CBS 101060]